IANAPARPHRNRTIEHRAAASAIERDGQEVDMPYERCWHAKPQRRYVIVLSSNKCSSYIRLGKKYSSPNVASAYRFLLLIVNISAYDKVDKEIVDAERQLSEALSRLSRLQRQREVLGNTGSELLS
ncbi:hypothetical protein C8A01DRAFT_20268, partial [Parachaetomium inaequale]